jgi:hypothetical protein
LQASPEATPGQASGNSSTREAVKKAANDQSSPELWSVHCLREAFEQARPMLAALTAVFTHHPLPIAWGIYQFHWCDQKRFELYTHKENNMRKVVGSMMVTLDGIISGPNGEMHVLPMTSNTIRMRRNGGNRR